MPATQSEARLEEIVQILHRMDRRDRLRTAGGFVRGLLGLIPLVFMLLSLWYVYTHADEILRTVAEQAAEQAARVAGESQDRLLEGFSTEELQRLLGR